MKPVFLIWICLLFLAALPLSGQGVRPREHARTHPSSVSSLSEPSGETEFISDTVQSRSLFRQKGERTAFEDLMSGLLGERISRRDELEIMKQQDQYYRQFKGRTIGEIHVIPRNIYDEDDHRWLSRASNRLHIVTREKKIRRDLLFRTGEALDPDEMMNNRRLLRSRANIADVDIIILPTDADSMVVDVFVLTRDSWTISADAGHRDHGKLRVELYDKNFLGWGNKLSVSTSFDWRNRFQYGGNRVEFEMINVLGTFFDGRLVAGKDFARSEYGVQFDKEFIRPTDYAGGVTVLRRSEDIDVWDRDTVYTTWGTVDMWGGFSFLIPRWKNSFYASLRYSYLHHLERPEVSETLNPYFHDRSMFYSEVGFYRERFRITNRLYGYGLNEYVAYGYKAGLVSGYNRGEFGDRWYAGLKLSWGDFTKIGYFGIFCDLGSYINRSDGSFYRSALNTEITYFTNLHGRRMYPVRQFITVGLTRGWKRLEGYQEFVSFSKYDQMHALKRRAFGQNRLFINTETVVFTPWHLYQFRFALFGFADFGLIGDNDNFFQNDFYNSLGIGVRIKNERLVFSTITLRFGVTLGKGGLLPSQYFRISSGDRMNLLRYIPQQPSIVEYR